MSTIWHTMMSLDGYIAGRDDDMDWIQAFAGRSAMADAVIERAGAVLAGRTWYDLATERWGGRAGIYGGRFHGPVFVLTHAPPADPPDPEIRFLTTGVADAVRTASDAAGGRDVVTFGADIGRQVAAADLLDELVIHLCPVMLGGGVRLYGGDDAALFPRLDLERTAVDPGTAVTDLRFSVRGPFGTP